MIIIGEKINGTLKPVAAAIAQRDAVFIQDLARRQADAGSDWLDIHAGTPPEKEADDLVWLATTVEKTVDVPLCLDSADPRTLLAAMDVVRRTPMINSISAEPSRMEVILPVAAKHGCPVIAMAMDETSISMNSVARAAVAEKIMKATRAFGIPDERIYFDPLVMTIGSDTQSGPVFLDTLKAVRKQFPLVHFTAGLSNCSFGLPARSLINRSFLTLAVAAGLDSVICNPLDRNLRSALTAAELVLGHDHYCLNFTQAYRSGKFHPIQKRG
jgi:cobalamin-dependent methionine synthase I